MTTMNKARHIAPIGSDHPRWGLTYEIEYSHCVRPDSRWKRDGEWQRRAVRVVMLRNAADPFAGFPNESFSVARCDNGELIADFEDCKADANSAARYWLMDQSRRAAESASEMAMNAN